MFARCYLDRLARPNLHKSAFGYGAFWTLVLVGALLFAIAHGG